MYGMYKYVQGEGWVRGMRGSDPRKGLGGLSVTAGEGSRSVCCVYT